MISLHDIIKTYHHKTILNIPSHTFESGSITGLTGKNGAGKTTLLKIIAGLLKPTGGHVLYNGQAFDNVRNTITYVPQEPYLFNMSVKENIAYPLRLRNMSEEEIINRTDLYISLFRLEEVKDQTGKTLSSGEKQKTALARSLVFEPKILLLDEPLSNVDIHSTDVIIDYLKNLQTELGMTILYVSHDSDQVNRVCNTVISLDDISLITEQ